MGNEKSNWSVLILVVLSFVLLSFFLHKVKENSDLREALQAANSITETQTGSIISEQVALIDRQTKIMLERMERLEETKLSDKQKTYLQTIYSATDNLREKSGLVTLHE